LFSKHVAAEYSLYHNTRYCSVVFVFEVIVSYVRP